MEAIPSQLRLEAWGDWYNYLHRGIVREAGASVDTQKPIVWSAAQPRRYGLNYKQAIKPREVTRPEN